MVHGVTEETYTYNQARAMGGDKIHSRKREFQVNRHGKKVNVHGKDDTSVAYVQILGTGMDTHDTMPSILLFFDKLRIIFNAGEGLQRFCAEHKIKLSKIDYICLSRVCSETVGGLPGLLLTLAGLGEGLSVNLRGPSDIKLLVAAMNSFIPQASIHVESFGSLFEDPITICKHSAVNISAVLLQPCLPEDSYVKPSDVSVIYICELAKIKGKFYREKAIALGVDAGPKYGQLQGDTPVKSDHLDRMVYPHEVMDPSIPGPIVFIVDCPTKRHAEKLFITQSFSSYYSGNKTVNCIIHLTPASVANSLKYQTWMKKFGLAQHIMAGHSMKNVKTPILRSSARIMNRLNYLCPQFFPAPVPLPLEHPSNAEVGFVVSNEDSIVKSCDAENLMKFTLRPHAHLGLDKSNIPSTLVSSQVIDDLVSEIPDIKQVSEEIKQLWCKPKEIDLDVSVSRQSKDITEDLPLGRDSLPNSLENIRRDDVEIVLLGTGSSQPSKYRNVSSIYFDLFSKGGLLLDCGEGTLAQLRRRYGMEGASNAVRSLRCIWISHIHADHHAGLVRILALRRDLLKGTPHEPLHVIGPEQLATILHRYNDLEDLNMQFIDCRSTTSASWDAFEGKFDNVNNEDEEDISSSKRRKVSFPMEDGVNFTLLNSLKEVLREAGLERLTSFPVVHCPNAFGVAIKARERMNNVGKLILGWKIVYSGDTRPCMEVIQASRGATLLIHEATFEDGLAGEAIARNHSTTKEAVEVGNSGGAYRIILTHFSQRYPKIPAFDDIDSQNACIAFDLMSINMADLHVLPHILPYLKLLFRTEATDDNLED